MAGRNLRNPQAVLGGFSRQLRQSLIILRLDVRRSASKCVLGAMQEAKMEHLEDDLEALKQERAALVAMIERATSESERKALQDRLENVGVEILALEGGEDA